VAGIEAGWFQREIAASARRQQDEIESGRRVIVGVNDFTEGSGKVEIDVLRIAPEVEARQHARLAKLRATRDAAAVERSLVALEQAARGAENLMPYLLDCAHAYATLHEIRDAMEKVFGIYHEPVSF
jgi:methylmalonyl-CoA mutase, N-terminal domain